MAQCDSCEQYIEKEFTCDHCRKGRYCSLDCKTLGTRITKCPPQKRLRSVDYLLIDVWDDEFPSNKQTIEDYGFGNCKTQNEWINLLGLYIGLLKFIRVPTDILYDHFMKDKIAVLIQKKFNELPAGSRGEYYPWFLRHQRIVKRIRQPNNALSVEQPLANSNKSKTKAIPSAKFSIQDGEFIINYGYNGERSYYYLNVQDKRLAWQSGLNDDVEGAINDIDSSGEGIILQLHTCSSSSLPIKGHQVSVETLAKFFKRYAIRNAHIEKMKQGKSF